MERGFPISRSPDRKSGNPFETAGVVAETAVVGEDRAACTPASAWSGTRSRVQVGVHALDGFVDLGRLLKPMVTASTVPSFITNFMEASRSSGVLKSPSPMIFMPRTPVPWRGFS